MRRKEEIFSKKNFTKSLPDKKKLFTFAPAKRKNSDKKVRHVPRHIELTAVPIYRDNNKESKRIERLEKTTRI